MTISVNGIAIEPRAVDAEVQYHPASSLEEARREAERALVIRHLLLQRAGQLGIEIADEDGEAAIQALLDREIRLPEPDEATCRRYYEQNRERFRSADLFEARHILFPAHADDQEARAEAKAKAEQTIMKLSQRPDAFAELAKTLSACPSAAQGGNLGQISRGQTVPEFETFLYNLEPGQLCPVPVPTRYGYHVLRLDHRVDGRELPFEMVHEKIARFLGESSWRRAVHQYIQILAGQARIEGVDLAASGSPLVQ